MGVEEFARLGAVLGIDGRCSRPCISSEALSIRRRCGSVAPVLCKGLPRLSVDEFGQGSGVGLIADVPGLQPGQLRIARSGAGLGHLGHSHVHRIGQDRGQQRDTVFRRVPALQVRKVRCKAGPAIHFQKQVGDLDVWQRCRDLIDQPLSCLRHGRVERRNLQAGVGQNRIGQIVRAGPTNRPGEVARSGLQANPSDSARSPRQRRAGGHRCF